MMEMMKKMRVGAITLALTALTLTAPVAASAATAVPFDMNATVFVHGEQVKALTLDASRLGDVDPASLSTDTFSVHAKSSNPLPPEAGQTVSNLYDTDREVTAVRVDAAGNIVIELATDPNVLGGFATFGSASPAGRGVMLDLTYTITQNRPFSLWNGSPVLVDEFVQRDLVDPEVDAFSHGVGADGMKYRLFTPDRIKKNDRRPLIVWLHGNGEGGLTGSYTNELPLRANRGALGPTTPEAQRIFGRAYVVAPQVPDTWYNHRESGYAAQIKAIIDRLLATERIDTNRIYVMGASAGGLMSVQLVSAYPTSFAAVVPSCPAMYLNRTGAYNTTAEEVLRLAQTPTWFIHAKSDPIIPYDKTSVWAHDLLPDSLLSLYDSVVWDGQEVFGHAVWVLTAENVPTTDKGRSLWEWMARQNLRQKHVKK